MMPGLVAGVRDARRWFAASVPLQMCATYAVAGLFYLGLAYLARSGDCAPHEVDGQCGIATFVGRLYGAVGAAVLVVGGHVLIAQHANARRRAATLGRGARASGHAPAP